MLPTVRSKLYALVALTAGSTLLTLAAVAWAVNAQVVDMVGDRMGPAVHGLENEMLDDVADAEAAARSLGDSTEVHESLVSGDPARALAKLQIFHESYPELDLVVFRSDGSLLTQLGVTQPPARLSDVEGLPPIPAGDSGALRAMLSDGCETNDDSVPPGFAVARRLGDDGVVLVCLPLSNEFVADMGDKLGVEIAVLDTDTAGLNAGTPGFPIEVLYGEWGGADALTDSSDGRTWAVARVDPEAIVGDSQVTLVAALDVSRVRAIVARTIGTAVLVVLVLSLLGLVAGSRIARTMSGALEQVSGAMRKLERSEYGHVTGVRTGDELEDLATGFNAMVDGLRERDKLRTTFGKYMTEQVMEHLLAGKVQLGGESLEVTVLFSDIRSFTTLSENMEAHALVALLNEYFTEMVAIIIEEGGVVDKYIGDAIMAVFGAPVPKPEDALRAVRAATRMRTALAALNERLEERGIAPIRTGIGIHTGEVVAGNIGSEARMEYTVIGDAVNLASRLEGATKDMGVDVLISADTYLLVADQCVCRPLEEIKVKGREAGVMTYALESMREPVAPPPRVSRPPV